jgi:hypothetical protein
MFGVVPNEFPKGVAKLTTKRLGLQSGALEAHSCANGRAVDAQARAGGRLTQARVRVGLQCPRGSRVEQRRARRGSRAEQKPCRGDDRRLGGRPQDGPIGREAAGAAKCTLPQGREDRTGWAGGERGREVEAQCIEEEGGCGRLKEEERKRERERFCDCSSKNMSRILPSRVAFLLVSDNTTFLECFWARFISFAARARFYTSWFTRSPNLVFASFRRSGFG